LSLSCLAADKPAFPELPESPAGLIETLKTGGDRYAIARPRLDYVKESDLPYLVGLLDSKEPCAFVDLSDSSIYYPGRSTVRHEAAYLIEGFWKRYYPTGLTSQQYKPDIEATKHWYRTWSHLQKLAGDQVGPGSGTQSVRSETKRTSSAALASGDDAAWSKPVKGLRGRLQVLPSQKADSPFCRVFIEFENVDDVAGQKRIRFSPDKLSLRVTDKEGRELALANGDYDGMSPLWETIALPYAGSMRFKISFPGLGYRPGTDKVIVDVGARKAWVIPQDGTSYFLSGSLSIEREKSDHPYMDWSGTLELPKVEIPKAK
jgi:hypothetical protein